jgi:hypothetical protein
LLALLSADCRKRQAAKMHDICRSYPASSIPSRQAANDYRRGVIVTWEELPNLPGSKGFHPAIVRAHSNAVSSSMNPGI